MGRMGIVAVAPDYYVVYRPLVRMFSSGPDSMCISRWCGHLRTAVSRVSAMQEDRKSVV